MSAGHTVEEVIASGLAEEGAGQGSSLHSWRCEHPDVYGPCTCVAEVARAVAVKLRRAGMLSEPVTVGREEVAAAIWNSHPTPWGWPMERTRDSARFTYAAADAAIACLGPFRVTPAGVARAVEAVHAATCFVPGCLARSEAETTVMAALGALDIRVGAVTGETV